MELVTPAILRQASLAEVELALQLKALGAWGSLQPAFPEPAPEKEPEL